MVRNSVVVLVAALSACSDHATDAFGPPEIDLAAVNAAVTDAQRYLGDGATVLAVCTGSVGKTYFLDDPNVDDDKEGLVEDGILEGVIIFARTPGGAPEILERDVDRQLIVASEDGGQITHYEAEANDGSGVWIVTFPTTGVTINYNLSRNERDELINLWTRNKPAISLLPPRASIFKSMCEPIL